MNIPTVHFDCRISIAQKGYSLLIVLQYLDIRTYSNPACFSTFITTVLHCPYSSLKTLSCTLENRSFGILETMMGSMELLLPKDASGMYNAHTTCAQPADDSAHNEHVVGECAYR